MFSALLHCFHFWLILKVNDINSSLLSTEGQSDSEANKSACVSV